MKQPITLHKRFDVTIIIGRHDYRASVYSSTSAGFDWLKHAYPEFPGIPLLVDNHATKEFKLRMEKAGLNVLMC